MNPQLTFAGEDHKATRTINGIVYEGHPEALDAMEASNKKTAERKGSVNLGEVADALNRIVRCLKEHDTGSTAQLKRFLWSLWNGHHQVNLYNLGRVLDDDNSDAVATVFNAYMKGLLSEDLLGKALRLSGEMGRWEAEDKARGEQWRDKTVDYPPTPESVREHCRKLDREERK